MALHETLRALVAARGPAVVEDAEEFRGALDDFLTEDEATTGELNLLVDAVRLGAVRRLVDSVRQGADPNAAVPEAGAMLARDRGTEDQARSAWAVAVIGYGLGVVDADAVAAAVAGIGTVEAPPVRPQGPAGGVPLDAERPRTLEEPAPVTAPSPEPPPPPPPSPPASPASPASTTDESRSRTGRMVLGLVAAAVVLGVVAGVAFAVLGGGDDEPSADRGPGAGATGTSSESATGKAKPAVAIPEERIVASYELDEESFVYAIDYRNGDARRLTDGPQDELPTVAPDRNRVLYLEGTDTRGKHLLVLDARDKTPAAGEPVFAKGSPCYYSNRPAFSPDGEKFALVCTDADRNPQGLYIGALDGTTTLVSADPSWWGAPTWLDDGRLVVTRTGATTDDRTLWLVDPADGKQAGANAKQLTDGGGGSDDYADWSTQAGRILFLRYDPATDPVTQVGEIWTVDPDGGQPERLSSRLVSHPAWSPDGTRIVCLVPDGAGGEQLEWLSFADPRKLHPVNAAQGNPTAPAWGTR